MIHIGTDRNGENHADGKISSVRIGHRLPIEYTQSLVHQTDATGPTVSTVNEVTRFLARATEPRMSTSVMSFLDFVDGEPIIYSSDSNATLEVSEVDNFGAQTDERSVVGARIMVSNVESGEPTRFYIDNPKIEVSDITYHVDPGSGWQQVYDFPSDNISSMLFSEHAGTNEVRVKIASTNSADWFKSAMVKPIYRTEIPARQLPNSVHFEYDGINTTVANENIGSSIMIFDDNSYITNGKIVGYSGQDPDGVAAITWQAPNLNNFTDDFNRANSNTVGNGWATYISSTSSTTLGIFSNTLRCYHATAARTFAIHRDSTASFDRAVEATMTATPNTLRLNMTSGTASALMMGNYGYSAFIEIAKSTVAIQRIDGGPPTTLATSGTIAVTAGTTYRFEHNRNGNMRLYVNGTLALSANDTTYMTYGDVGSYGVGAIISTSAVAGLTDGSIDNFITEDMNTVSENAVSWDLTSGNYSYQVFYPNGEYSSPAQI